jgi:hypothetical protein
MTIGMLTYLRRHLFEITKLQLCEILGSRVRSITHEIFIS